MSAQLMRPGRRKFSSGDMFKGALEEYADEAIGYLAYSGPFHVDEVTSTLTHSMTVSLFPGWLGQTQPRVAKLEGTRLELSTSAPTLSGGVEVMAHLQWERATPNGVASATNPRRNLSRAAVFRISAKSAPHRSAASRFVSRGAGDRTASRSS